MYWKDRHKTLVDIMEGLEDKEYIWSDIALDARLSKDVLISLIIEECSTSIPLYQLPDILKYQTEQFFKMWEYQIGKLIDTQEFEYNPIWNKDGEIKEERHGERDKEQGYREEGSERSNSTINGTNVNDEAPFNTDNYHTKVRDTSDSKRNDNSDYDRGSTTNENESNVEVVTRTERGNIGITSTQALITEERNLYNFNVYEWIVQRYSEQLFLGVW